MTAEAYKLSGGGNDFIALAEPAELPPAELVRAWCTRRLSIGADGLFVITRRSGGIGMRHFNADGGVAELCLNGTRCAARLAFELGWAENRLTIFTDSGAIEARATGDESVALELAPPGPSRQLALEAGGRTWAGWFLVVGVPHLVIPWEESVTAAPLASAGPALRSHPALGESGANVNFVHYGAPDRFELRTWERGVEGETLSCGSGALAAAAVGLASGACTLPVGAMTRGGFRLEVDGRLDSGRLARWSLAGDARLVGRLSLLAGATAFSTPEPGG